MEGSGACRKGPEIKRTHGLHLAGHEAAGSAAQVGDGPRGRMRWRGRRGDGVTAGRGLDQPPSPLPHAGALPFSFLPGRGGESCAPVICVVMDAEDLAPDEDS